MKKQDLPVQDVPGTERSFAADLIQQLVVPAFVIDADCRVLIWNAACARLTGMNAEEVMGTHEHWRAFYDEPRPCLADLIAQGRTKEIGSLYAENKDQGYTSHVGLEGHAENWCVMPRVGTRLYLAIDAGPIFDQEGKLIAVVETLRDVTVEKEAQLALERLASKDSLTGLANRRTFDEMLQVEWRRALRASSSLSVVMADVDYFKRYNDQFGHLEGDQCLKALASSIGAEFKRAGDLVARYGGEEFVVILPQVTRNDAVTLAERLRESIRQLQLPHPASDVDQFVTVSLGVATVVPTANSTPDALVSAADRALYEAKRGGRNRVSTADVLEGPEGRRLS